MDKIANKLKPYNIHRVFIGAELLVYMLIYLFAYTDFDESVTNMIEQDDFDCILYMSMTFIGISFILTMIKVWLFKSDKEIKMSVLSIIINLIRIFWLSIARSSVCDGVNMAVRYGDDISRMHLDRALILMDILFVLLVAGIVMAILTFIIKKLNGDNNVEKKKKREYVINVFSYANILIALMGLFMIANYNLEEYGEIYLMELYMPNWAMSFPFFLLTAIVGEMFIRRKLHILLIPLYCVFVMAIRYTGCRFYSENVLTAYDGAVRYIIFFCLAFVLYLVYKVAYRYGKKKGNDV